MAPIDASNFLAFLDSLPGTNFQMQLSHAFVQEVAGIRPNRSHVNAEAGYFVTPRLAVRVLESWQITHDGLDFPYAGLPSELSLNHDRLSRNNFLIIGAGSSSRSTSLGISSPRPGRWSGERTFTGVGGSASA